MVIYNSNVWWIFKCIARNRKMGCRWSLTRWNSKKMQQNGMVGTEAYKNKITVRILCSRNSILVTVKWRAEGISLTQVITKLFVLSVGSRNWNENPLRPKGGWWNERQGTSAPVELGGPFLNKNEIQPEPKWTYYKALYRILCGGKIKMCVRPKQRWQVRNLAHIKFLNLAVYANT